MAEDLLEYIGEVVAAVIDDVLLQAEILWFRRTFKTKRLHQIANRDIFLLWKLGDFVCSYPVDTGCPEVDHYEDVWTRGSYRVSRWMEAEKRAMGK